MRITCYTLLAAAVLIAPLIWATPAPAGDPGYWRLLDCLNNTLEDPNSGYTCSASFNRGSVKINESGKYQIEGELSWSLGPPDDKLVGGASVPFKAAYYAGYGRGNPYGYIYYGFASAPVMQPSWWEQSAEAPVFFDTSQAEWSSTHTFTGASITIPLPPPGGQKYMYIGFAAVGAFSIQAEYFMVYEWVEGSPDESANAKVKGPCEEAMAFYGVNQLQGLYTGKGSQKFTRDELAEQLVDALVRYQAPGRKISDGTMPVHNSGEYILDTVPVPITDALEIARTFDTKGLPTGNESTLHALVADYARKRRENTPDYRLTPGDLFYLALDSCNGNIRDALVTCHSALDRNTPANKVLVDTYLCQLRDPQGYTDGDWSYTTEKGSTRTLNPRRDLASDEQGVWYHFYGMAALEFTDKHNYAPFFATQEAVFAKLNQTKTDKVRRRGLKLTEIGGALADLAIALEDASRSAYGGVPDPDKQCLNYAGVIAARMLRAKLEALSSMSTYPRKPSPPQFDHMEQLGGQKYEQVYDFRSPLAVKITGTGGEVFTFDQQQKVFDGNTPCVFCLVNPEPDGTWGLTIAPQFKVASVEFTATAAGNGQVAQYNSQTGETKAQEFTLTSGQLIDPAKLGIIPSSAAQDPATKSSANGATDWKLYTVGSVELYAPPNWEYTAETAQDYASWTYSEQGSPVAGVMLIENDSPAQAVIDGLKLQVTPGAPQDLGGLPAATWSGSWQGGAASVRLYSLLQPLSNGHRIHVLVVNTAGRESEFAATCAGILKQLRLRAQ